MDNERPQLFGTLRNESTLEVRRLLTIPTDAQLTLLELSAGNEKILGVGSPYEMRGKAQSLLELYVGDGFKVQKEEHVFEPLGAIIALALKMGYTIIYDRELTSATSPSRKIGHPINLTGEVPLSQWPGCTGKNGGAYEYAFGHMKIYAQPRLSLPPDLRAAPESGKEFAAFLSKIMSLRNDIGPFREFLIAGHRYA